MPKATAPAAANGLPTKTDEQTVWEIYAAADPEEQRSAIEFLRRGRERARLRDGVRLADTPERAMLYAYRQWLHYEGALLGDELFPELDEYADRFIPETFAKAFHFPIDGDWRKVPKPSTRAAAVLRAVGAIAAPEAADATDWRGMQFPGFPVGGDFHQAWSLYQALRTLNEVAIGLFNQPRFQSDGNLNQAGRSLEALQMAIAGASDQIADAARSAHRSDGDGYYRALIIVEDAPVSLKGLDEIPDLVRELRDN